MKCNSLQSYINRKKSEEIVKSYLEENGLNNDYSLSYSYALANENSIDGYDYKIESNTDSKRQFTIRYLFPDTIIPLSETGKLIKIKTI